MKTFVREFSLVEKVLFVALALILAGVLYYQFFHVPVSRDMDSAVAWRDELESQMRDMQLRLSQLSLMEKELERYGNNEGVSWMPSYNSSTAEIALLNSILEAAERYSVSFAAVTRDGDQIRRGFAIQFTTQDFWGAKSIISNLTGGEYRCLLSSLRYAVNPNAESAGRIIVSVEGAFYETMVGGTPDIALPD